MTYEKHKCKMCGKEFYPAPEHAYKMRNNSGDMILYCTWGCLSKAKKEKEERIAANRKKMGKKKITMQERMEEQNK